MSVSAILAAGGRGTRMGAGVPKQLLMLGDRSILQRSYETLASCDYIAEIIVALPSELVSTPPPFLKPSATFRLTIVDGGATRHQSVANAFARIDETRTDYVLIHDAARPLASSKLFQNVMVAARQVDAAVPALRASDTVKEASTASDYPSLPKVIRSLPRDAVYLVQTPQVFHYDCLSPAMEVGRQAADATDEATLVERAGFEVRLVEGEAANIKITTDQDLRVAETLLGIRDADRGTRSQTTRIGTGYDLHRLQAGRRLIIGGVDIPHETGLIGHSDADVLSHAVTDAILGAAAAGDIGQHFPDTSPLWEGANSIDLLKQAAEIVKQAGYDVSNVDAVVIAEQPRLLPHIPAMRAQIAAALGVDVSAVGIKDKTNKRDGEIGRSEAIAVHAVALLRSRG